MKVDTTEISPFTGKKSVVVEEYNNVETRICMDTGFTTNSEYKTDSDKIEEFESTTSELIRNLRYTDEELGQYWYPTTVMFTNGIIYPEGGLTDWMWVYAHIVELTEEEKKVLVEKEWYDNLDFLDVFGQLDDDDMSAPIKTSALEDALGGEAPLKGRYGGPIASIPYREEAWRVSRDMSPKEYSMGDRGLEAQKAQTIANIQKLSGAGRDEEGRLFPGEESAAKAQNSTRGGPRATAWSDDLGAWSGGSRRA